jgi:DNA topoisomerase I
LFQYLDEQGEYRCIGSADVNDYIREVTGQPFTAKDFRTWGATLLAARTLRSVGTQPTQRRAVRALNEALAEVASALHNTVAICRSSYVHPAVMDAFLDGSLESRWERAATTARGGRRSEEATLVAFLRSAARAASRARGTSLSRAA